MIRPKELKFKKLKREGLTKLVDWAKAEGWNPGPHDADVYWQTDPDGFYGYFLDDELIAGGSVVSYDGNFGFMGFFIVKPEKRSRGIGRHLWMQRRNLLISRLKPGAPIGMDGVVDLQPFYNKGGFKIAFRDERYRRTGEQFSIDQHISPIADQDFDSILQYDASCFGFHRPKFLKPWLSMPGSKAYKYYQEGNLKGFVLLRKASSGYKIGPLFADNYSIAESLYKACLNAVPGEDVFLDIPVVNEDAVKLIKKYQAVYVFECARMYFGHQPKQEVDKIFGITTFELG